MRVSRSCLNGGLTRARASPLLGIRPTHRGLQTNSAGPDYESGPSSSYSLKDRLRQRAGAILLWSALSSISIHLYRTKMDFRDAQEKNWARLEGVKELARAVRSGETQPTDQDLVRILEALNVANGSDEWPLVAGFEGKVIHSAITPPPAPSNREAHESAYQIQNIPSIFANDPIFGVAAQRPGDKTIISDKMSSEDREPLTIT